MNWFVYAIYNKKSNKIYIGQTNNLDRRLSEHNSKFGNHFTAKVDGEWKLTYKEIFKCKKEAIIREKELKSFRGREFIKKMIINIPL